MNLAELRAKLKEERSKAKSIIAKAENEKRSLNDDEIKELDAISADIEKREKEIEVREKLEGKLKEDPAEEPKTEEKRSESLLPEKVEVTHDGTYLRKQAKLMNLYLRSQKDKAGVSSKVIEELREGMNECREAWDKYLEKRDLDGNIAGTDASGGYLIRPEFDAEIDKLVFKTSAFIGAISFRMGNEKTEINGISTFDFTDRASENVAFTETKVTVAQEEVKYKDTGAIIPISNRLIESADVNLMIELQENAVDAKIRYYEANLTTGKTSGQHFNGIYFVSGITSVDAINKGGTNKLVSKDLTRMYLGCPAQSRANLVFIMDSIELMLLMDETDNEGRPTEPIATINGRFYHKRTGKEIIAVDNMRRTLNGTTDNTTGTDIAVLGGDLRKFRVYKNGGMRIDMSADAGFEYDQVKVRFIEKYKSAIPSYSKTSFVSLSGIKENFVA